MVSRRTFATRSVPGAAVFALAALVLQVAPVSAKTTITFLANARQGPTGKDAVSLLADEYNKRQSDVVVKYVAAGDWSEQATVAMVGGVPYDVVAGWESQLRVFVEGGMALDLSPYFPSSSLSDFSPAQLDVFRVKGKLMAMPYYMGVSSLFYNEDIFAKAGVPEPGGWDWADLIDNAKKMTIGKVGAKTKTQYGFSVSPMWDRQALWVQECGGKAIDAGKVMGNKCYLDSPEALQGITFQRDLVFKQGVSPNNASSGDWDLFWAGKLGVWESGSWDIGPTMSKAKFRWNVAKRPKSPLGISAASLTTDGFFIPKNTKHRKEAVGFLKYLTSPEAEETLMTVSGLQPARKSIAAKYAADSVPAKQGIRMNVFLEQAPYALPAPMFTHQKIAADLLSNALYTALFKESADPVRTMVDFTKHLNTILSK